MQVGFLEGATYPNGTPVGLVAYFAEYGTGTEPPRAFFRPMIAEKSDGWGEEVAQALKNSDFDATEALENVSGTIEGELREYIIKVDSPPLSPITLMLRKMFGNHPEEIRGRDVGEAARRVAAGEDTGGVSTKPLVWTGHLLNSIDHKVVR